MRKVYTAADPLQAHVLRGALEAAGIEAEVRGTWLFGVRGETPVTVDTAPSVWIRHDEDWDVAMDLVRELEAKPARGPIRTWRCRACGEFVEDQFGECWNCGASRSL
ncbi:MAG: DUF2007 domain-containing protein [Vicinamibacterales bacterium]